jgi:hypothetical protein
MLATMGLVHLALTSTLISAGDYFGTILVTAVLI